MSLPAAWRAEDLEESHMMLLYMIHLYSAADSDGSPGPCPPSGFAARHLIPSALDSAHACPRLRSQCGRRRPGRVSMGAGHAASCADLRGDRESAALPTGRLLRAIDS